MNESEVQRELIRRIERSAKEARRRMRKGVKHAEGSTRPDLAARVAVRRKKSKAAAKSRKRNR